MKISRVITPRGWLQEILVSTVTTSIFLFVGIGRSRSLVSGFRLQPPVRSHMPTSSWSLVVSGVFLDVFSKWFATSLVVVLIRASVRSWWLKISNWFRLCCRSDVSGGVKVADLARGGACVGVTDVLGRSREELFFC